MTAPVAAPCKTCGTSLPGDSAFCPSCGAKTGVVVQASAPVTTHERIRAALADRYNVLRELGEGGMATVFLAEDVRHDRKVAIKVLHPELAASMGAERFHREIRTAAKLQHPHILSLYDSGEADGLFYFVMPFVEGESLRDRIDRDKLLPIEDAVGITLEVADALGYAHKQGIVHRDIKPENIMLSGGHALVADFGIARAMSGGEGGAKLTKTGSAIGTPLYMSPEQAYGEDVGPTADLYSLACVTYEMLTGQPPFTGASAQAIMARHTVEVVPSLRVVRDAIPEEVEEAILVTLAKVPADRPQSAAKFAELLGTPLGSATARMAARSRYTMAPRLSTIINRPPVYKRPGVMIGVVAGIALATTAGWLALKGGNGDAGGTLPVSNIAVMYLEDLSPRSDLGFLSDGLTEGLIDALRGIPALTVISKTGSAQFRGTSVQRDSVARALGVGTLVWGSVDQDGANYEVTLRIAGEDGFERDRVTFSAAGDVLALGDSLARRGAELIRSRVGATMGALRQREGTRSTDAWVLLQRAERLRKQADSVGRTGDDDGFFSALHSADSLLARAEQLDSRWPEPAVHRSANAYARSRRAVADPAAALLWIDSGLSHATRSLMLEDNNPDALELRGNLQYWKWLLGLETNDATAAQILATAQTDLERATELRPSQAGAWSTLSHLYNNVDGKTGVDINFAARNALQADAFLTNADRILQRLFFSSYDLGQFPTARGHCDEGLRRFPANPWFTECRLFMMTSRADSADVARAWVLADSLLVLTPPSDTAYVRRQSHILVAAVLARAGQPDSARRLVGRSLGGVDIDPTRDLANLAGFVYVLVGDRDRAVQQVGQYLAANPRRRTGFRNDPGWWYSPIAGDPAFQRLVTTGR